MTVVPVVRNYYYQPKTSSVTRETVYV